VQEKLTVRQLLQHWDDEKYQMIFKQSRLGGEYKQRIEAERKEREAREEAERKVRVKAYNDRCEYEDIPEVAMHVLRGGTPTTVYRNVDKVLEFWRDSETGPLLKSATWENVDNCVLRLLAIMSSRNEKVAALTLGDKELAEACAPTCNPPGSFLKFLRWMGQSDFGVAKSSWEDPDTRALYQLWLDEGAPTNDPSVSRQERSA
jgi:hypothetical protein